MAEKLSELKHKQFVNLAIDFILSASTKKEIVEYFVEVFQFEEKDVELLIQAAYRKLTIENIDEIGFIVDQHTSMYEAVYKKFSDLGFTPGMLKSLRYKEKLLGMHQDNTNIVVNNQMNIEINQTEFDLSKLSQIELTRLEALLDKTSKNEHLDNIKSVRKLGDGII